MKTLLLFLFALIILNINPVYAMGEKLPTDGHTHRAEIKPVYTHQQLRGDYPAEWWKKVPRKDAKSWEILPQDAGPGEVILSKRTELGIFSNFGHAPFEYDGEEYASIEGFWQMMKYPESPDDERLKDSSLVWPHTRDEVKAMSGFEAKYAGDAAGKNMRALGIKWKTYRGEKIYYKGKGQARHYELILGATRAKIEQNPKVKALLMKTKGLRLRPDHDQGPRPRPSYKYYEILMKIRDGQ